MAANTKYQRAPERDSFDEPSYTQAPPSYQDESSQRDGLLGSPRGEDDNVPDDFKVCYNSKHFIRTVLMLRKVWRLRCRGYAPNTNAVHPEGLRHTVSILFAKR